MGKVLDTTGLRSADVILQIAMQAAEMQSGDILQVVGDCPNFDTAVRGWCQRLGKNWLAFRRGPKKRRRI